MSTEVASLHATIGAKIDGFKQGAREVKTELDNLKSGFGSFMAGVGTASAAATLAMVGLKKVMEFGKEGAELELTETRFVRLAASIGTTADALKTDLRAATRGMMSDSEMMASATTMMTLGLAKTREEAVRLTRVASALGMNMNQLVLTLTNQTTMRFDQLGVSVDGFAEKVDALKAAGMSANDAFKEAFLQQAEEQITKVGDAADSSVASFVKFEVATQNLGDALKSSLGPTLARVADGLTYMLTGQQRLQEIFAGASTQVYNTSNSYDEYADRMRAAASAAGYYVNASGALIGTRGQLVNQNYMLSEGEYKYAKAMQASAEATSAQTDASKGDTTAQIALGMSIEANTKYTASYRAAMVMANIAINAQKLALERDVRAFEEADERAKKWYATQKDLVQARRDLAEAEKKWSQTVGQDVKGAFDKVWMSQDKYREGLKLIDEALGTNLAQQQSYQDELDQLAKDFASGKLDPAAFKEKLATLRDAYKPLEDSIGDAMKKVEDLEAKLRELENQHINTYVDIWYVEHGKPPSGGGGNTGESGEAGTAGPRQYGGPAMGGKVYLVGERGPEYFIPYSSGQIIPNSQIGKASGASGGGAPVIVYQYNNTRAAAALAAAQIRQMRSKRLNASMG